MSLQRFSFQIPPAPHHPRSLCVPLSSVLWLESGCGDWVEGNVAKQGQSAPASALLLSTVLNNHAPHPKLGTIFFFFYIKLYALNFHLFIYVFAWEHMFYAACLCGGQTPMSGNILTFYRVGLGYQGQVVKLGGKPFYRLSYLAISTEFLVSHITAS